MSRIAETGDLNATHDRLQSRVGTATTQSPFAVERTKVQEFARALPPGGPQKGDVPLTFYEAARLQQPAEWFETLDLDPRRMLHAEQEIRIAKPLTIGVDMTISTILESVRCRAGRRAGEMLLLTMRTSFDAGGCTWIEAWRRVLLVTASPTGCPLPRTDDRSWVGAWAVPAFRLQDVVRYAGASGDFNPVHYDRDLACERGDPDVFAQGMLGAGTVAEVARSVVADPIGGLRFRFRDRIWLGRPLEVVWRPEAPDGVWTFVLRDDESDKVEGDCHGYGLTAKRSTPYD